MEKWSVCNRLGDFEGISRKFGLSPISARLLVNRGLTGEDEIRSFLYPDEGMLHSPKLLMNLEKAADIVAGKIRDKQKIRVVGDYDCDGIMSTYILTDALTRLGADVSYYIPDRVKDGYGINCEMIQNAKKDCVNTIITCDNGISAIPASVAAKQLGITLVITDHHDIPDVLPEADVIVNAKQENETYPCRDICGAVTAAKLAALLLENAGICEAGKGCLDYLEFMAMATICDVVPLNGENRVIARLGLDKINRLYLPVLNRLEESGIEFEKSDMKQLTLSDEGRQINLGLLALLYICETKKIKVTDYTVGYVLGPCLNATGRLDIASRAMLLLNSSTCPEAFEYAETCRDLNEERKKLTNDFLLKAYEILEQKENIERVIVVYLPDCHESLAGIIAGRIRERYCRPSFVLTKSGEGIKGSGRSIPEYNMFAELKKCSELFSKFGGHPMAAGISLLNDDPEELSRRLNEQCSLTDEDMTDKILLDAAVGFNAFGIKEVNELELFAPFGQGNRNVLFGERNLEVIRISYMGRENSYLRFDVVNSFGYRYQIPYFKDKDQLISELENKYGNTEVDAAFKGRPNRIRITVAYIPKLNSYKGEINVQMNLRHIKV